MNKILKVAIMVATCLAVGYFSSLITQQGVNTWYPAIQKPAFTPPNWLFAPVWSIMYTLMGVAAGLVWNRIDFEKDLVKQGLKFFWIQLALNALWSYLFFGLRNPMLALIEIVLLELMIYETYIKFKAADKIAGWLLIPYLLWVAFATVLTAAIWWLN